MPTLGDGGTGAAGGAGAGAAGTGGSGGTGGQGGAGGSGSGGAGSGGASGSWRDSISADIRNDPSISSFQDVDSLTKAFIHTKSLVGKKGAIPPEDWSKATPEDKAAFFGALGVPGKDKYTVTAPKDSGMDDTTLAWYKDQMADLGIMPHQANGFLENYAKFNKDVAAKSQAAKDEATKAEFGKLVQEWGGADGYTAKLASAERMAQACSPEFQDFLKKSGMGNDPVLIKEMYALSRKYLKEGSIKGDGSGDPAESRGEIKSQIDEIMANADKNGYADAKHPMHNITVAKVGKLAERLYGR